MPRSVAIMDCPENRAPEAEISRIVGDSMFPVLENGWHVRVDTNLTTPHDGEIVVVHFEGEGRIVGYWNGGKNPILGKANPAYESVDVHGKAKPWRIVGTVTHIVWAAVRRRRSPTRLRPAR